METSLNQRSYGKCVKILQVLNNSAISEETIKLPVEKDEKFNKMENNYENKKPG